jgi:uncharacterized phage-like protein YoqJ
VIVAVTGHRPDKIGGYNFYASKRVWIRDQLMAKLWQLKPVSAISGMALGVDQDFAYTCVWAGIPFLAAIPFVGQEAIWPEESRQLYNELLSRAYEKVVVSPGGYSAKKMQVRNAWMVNHCDVLIAVWDGSQGGTGNCVAYAQSVGRPIERINPSEFPGAP